MKSATFLAAGLLTLSSLFTSCAPEHDALPTTREVITQGVWKVTSFTAGQDQTAQYRQVQLTFGADGRIECTHGSDRCSGLWNVDRSGSTEVLQVHLNSDEAYLQPLKQDWSVLASAPAQLSLKGGNATLQISRF
ncbi:MAG TPA: hypothetical protein VHK69_21705 [Chitinophagaceae bacterium]|jgi:hypothetical protein|nr:hypothetical protein [Chitinophagaceae bacterium]